MARRSSSGRTEIIIAAIGLIGVIVAALIANWDKIFPRAAAPAASVTTNAAAPASSPAAATLPVGAVERQAAAQEKALNASSDALEDIAAKIDAANANNH